MHADSEGKSRAKVARHRPVTDGVQCVELAVRLHCRTDLGVQARLLARELSVTPCGNPSPSKPSGSIVMVAPFVSTRTRWPGTIPSAASHLPVKIGRASW